MDKHNDESNDSAEDAAWRVLWNWYLMPLLIFSIIAWFICGVYFVVKLFAS